VKTKNRPALPEIVPMDQWQAAHDALLKKEKSATHDRDALAAERRRMPMVEIEKDYVFEGPDGRASFLDLFDGRRQLIVYHFMFAPGVEGWPEAGCPGCSFFVDQITHLAGAGVSRSAGEHPEVPAADGLERTLVFVIRKRLQPRLQPQHRSG
jgi:predicted dithiol-disulfide oxidoreductase (DUF899 family)